MTYTERTCKKCGKKFKVPTRVLKTGRGKYCSTKCRLACLNSKPKGWRAHKGKVYGNFFR